MYFSGGFYLSSGNFFFKSNKVISILIPIKPQCRAPQPTVSANHFKHRQVGAWESGRLQDPQTKVRTAGIYCVNTVSVCWALSSRREGREDISCGSWRVGRARLSGIRPSVARLPKSWTPSGPFQENKILKLSEETRVR